MPNVWRLTLRADATRGIKSSVRIARLWLIVKSLKNINVVKFDV
jgi:hypothetical protein